MDGILLVVVPVVAIAGGVLIHSFIWWILAMRERRRMVKKYGPDVFKSNWPRF